MWMWIPFHSFNRYCLIGSICLITVTSSGYSQGGYGSLDLVYHVRTLSLSGVGVADNKGMDATVVNPALIQNSSQTLLLSVIRYPANIQSEVVEWRMPIRGRTGALSLRHLGYGIFDERNREGVKTGQFGAADTWISMSLAQSIYSFFDVGLSIGLYYSQLHHVNAILGLLTGGVILKIDKFQLKVGASVKNLGLTLDYYTKYREPIPTYINLGLLKSLAYLPLDLMVEGSWSRGQKYQVIRMGGEFTLPYHFTLRWGTTNQRFHQGTDILWQTYLAGTTLGLGYSTANLTTDIGMGYRGAGGTIIGIGFSMRL